jgi:hypothetical protein
LHYRPPLDEGVWVVEVHGCVEVQARAQPLPAAKWVKEPPSPKVATATLPFNRHLMKVCGSSSSTAASRCTRYPWGRCRGAVVTQCVDVEGGLHSGLGEDGDGLGVRWSRQQQWRSIWETADATLEVSAGIVEERRVG